MKVRLIVSASSIRAIYEAPAGLVPARIMASIWPTDKPVPSGWEHVVFTNEREPEEHPEET